MERAAEHGLCVSKPWGETSPYDFVVETGGKLWRVQVKSTWSMNRGVYVISIRKQKGGYPPGSYDFLAAYLIPIDMWFIVPENKVRAKLSVGLFPETKRSKYLAYREAWKLLTGGETPDETGPKNLTGSQESGNQNANT
jgi:hypothetical protein